MENDRSTYVHMVVNLMSISDAKSTQVHWLEAWGSNKPKLLTAWNHVNLEIGGLNFLEFLIFSEYKNPHFNLPVLQQLVVLL